MANRIGEIQRLTDIKCWRHIASSDNPADVLSRGLYSEELMDASLWWRGFTFMQLHEEHWPNGDIIGLGDNTPEGRKTTAVAVSCNYSIIDGLLKKHSSLNKICRIIAYCLRFRKLHRQVTSTKFVSHGKISYAEGVCKVVQKVVFHNEYNQLAKGKPISASSKLLSLTPFMEIFPRDHAK